MHKSSKWHFCLKSHEVMIALMGHWRLMAHYSNQYLQQLPSCWTHSVPRGLWTRGSSFCHIIVQCENPAWTLNLYRSTRSWVLTHSWGNPCCWSLRKKQVLARSICVWAVTSTLWDMVTGLGTAESPWDLPDPSWQRKGQQNNPFPIQTLADKNKVLPPAFLFQSTTCFTLSA